MIWIRSIGMGIAWVMGLVIPFVVLAFVPKHNITARLISVAFAKSPAAWGITAAWFLAGFLLGISKSFALTTNQFFSKKASVYFPRTRN
jgi:hypothetical protein